MNDSTGIAVHSMLPDEQFDGTSSGDLQDSLETLVSLGRFTTSTDVNVGDAG